MKRLIIFLLAVMLIFTVGCKGPVNSKAAKANNSADKNSTAESLVADTGISVPTISITGSGISNSPIIGSTTAKTDENGRTIKVDPINNDPGNNPTTTVALKPVVTNALGYTSNSVGDKVVSPYTNYNYTLKFIYQFEGTSINTNNWTVDTGNYNASEGQANLPENVVVKDGKLNIYGKKDTKKHSRKANWGEALPDTYYTGGAINSNKKKVWQFGRLEILAKLPFSQGMWPAFWTVGTQRGWPWGGEIDITEMVGGDDQWGNVNREGGYNCGVHWCKPEATTATAYSTDHKSTGGTYNLPNKTAGGKLADAWHVYGLEWTNKKLVYYIDNIKVTEVSLTDTTMREAFFQNHYVILNLAMGSKDSKGVQNWATEPDSFSKTVWPQDFQIEWYKVWQR